MVQFADFVRRTDVAVETAWCARDWGTFVKLWLVTAIGVAVCFLLLILAGGAILIETNRVYHLFRAGTEGPAVAFNAMLLYAGLWNFASPFAAVTAVVGLVSGPFMMIGKGGKSEKTES
jgi:hypothetical protein